MGVLKGKRMKNSRFLGKLPELLGVSSIEQGGSFFPVLLGCGGGADPAAATPDDHECDQRGSRQTPWY